MGTDTTTAVRIFLAQAIANNGFPFEIKRTNKQLSAYKEISEDELAVRPAQSEANIPMKNFSSADEVAEEVMTKWEYASSDVDVVITSNGKPTAIMVDIADGSFEETIKAVKQAKAALAFNRMRNRAAKSGYMSEADIDAEISAVRKGE